MEQNSSKSRDGSAQMRRRTIVKGAAWAAPVVSLGAAAPAFAASPSPVTPSVGQASCKHTKGVKRYHIELIFTNNLSCSVDVRITYFAVNPFSGQDVPFVPPVDLEFTLGANGSKSWEYDSIEVGNIANGTVDLSYTYTDCQGNPVDESQSLTIPSLPPCVFAYPHDGTKESELEEAESTSEESTSESPTSDSGTDSDSTSTESGSSPTSTSEPDGESSSTEGSGGGDDSPTPAATSEPTGTPAPSGSATTSD